MALTLSLVDRWDDGERTSLCQRLRWAACIAVAGDRGRSALPPRARHGAVHQRVLAERVSYQFGMNAASSWCLLTSCVRRPNPTHSLSSGEVTSVVARPRRNSDSGVFSSSGIAMPEVQLNGYVTYYEDDCFVQDWLPRQTVLIQHGFGRNSQFWRHWVPLLSGDYRVIRRDLRGHGGSGDPGDAYPWSFDSLVRDLSAFCEALKLDTVHLLGESTGGMLAVGFATTRPKQLRSITLCATPVTIKGDSQKFFAAGRASWQDALMEMGSEGWARWLLSQPGTAPPGDPERTAWSIKQFGRSSPASLAAYSKVISTTDITPLLPQVRVPALVLAPTRSAATSIIEQECIAASLWQSELLQIDGAGHEIYIDRAEECVSALRGFLDGFA